MSIILDWRVLRVQLARDLDRFLSSEKMAGCALQRYALVDAGQVPELRSDQFRRPEIEHISLFSLTSERAIAKYGPLLIPIDSQATSETPMVARLLRTMRDGWTVSWLSSALSLADLAQHLAGHLNGTLSDGSDVLVRYYDPRLASAFLSHLDGPVRSALLAPIGHWAWWDRKLTFVIEAGGNGDISPGVTNTDISAVTQAAMAAAAMVDLIASMVVAERDGDEFAQWLPHTLYNTISGQIDRGREHGLNTVSDLQLFASLALRVHPDFFALLPIFSSEKKRLAAGEVDLPTLVLSVGDDAWNRLGNSGGNVLEQLRQSVNKELFSTVQE